MRIRHYSVRNPFLTIASDMLLIPHTWMRRTLLLGLFCPFLLITSSLRAYESSEAQLVRINREVTTLRQKLGDRAGMPEVEDKFTLIPPTATWLTAAEAQPAFARLLSRIESIRWWKIGLDPTRTEHALREPAAVIIGCLAAYRARLDGADHALALAREAGDFLVWAQDEAGTGVFPFPAVRGGKGAAFRAAEKFLAQAARAGRTADLVHRGWIVDDAEDGGLQFDNGEAGVALLELHAETGDPRYLKSAVRAADWAENRPIVRNWNYNSFSVHLLARVYAVTGGRRYLDAALRKARVGVIPGQLTDGPRAGRWLDPHNARPAYHYIMMRALTELVAVLPPEDRNRDQLVITLRRGLLARNSEFSGPGAATKEEAMNALLRVRQVFASDLEFLHNTQTDLALDALGRLVSAQYRRGGEPMSPRGLGQFLAYAVVRSPE